MLSLVQVKVLQYHEKIFYFLWDDKPQIPASIGAYEMRMHIKLVKTLFNSIIILLQLLKRDERTSIPHTIDSLFQQVMLEEFLTIPRATFN